MEFFPNYLQRCFVNGSTDAAVINRRSPCHLNLLSKEMCSDMSRDNNNVPFNFIPFFPFQINHFDDACINDKLSAHKMDVANSWVTSVK